MCAALYESVFQYYKGTYPRGLRPDRMLERIGEGEIVGNPFRLLDLLVLADIYLALDRPLEAIRTIRKGCAVAPRTCE